MIDVMYCFPRNKGEDPPPEWPDKWFDRKFMQSVTKLSDTFHKIELVAWLLEKERKNIFENKDQRELEKFSIYSHALRVVPIHLDSLLFYTRIIADSIADLTPYLYPKMEGQQIANRSFRDHKKWFLKHKDYDQRYTHILTGYSQWFDLLAGKEAGEGFRDKIIHHRGTFQLSYTNPAIVDDFKLTAGIVGDSGWIIDDIFPKLVQIILDLFIYLDHFTDHFCQTIGNKLGANIFNLESPKHTELYRFNKPLESFWVYPKVNRIEK
jgi:hypothetical protein